MPDSSDDPVADEIARELERLDDAELKIATDSTQSLAAWIQHRYGMAMVQAMRVAPLVHEILKMLGIV